MEVFIFFILVVGAPIAYYARKEYLKPGSIKKVDISGGIDNTRAGRKCLSCGFKGQMKTWLSNYNTPQFIVLIGLLFFMVPGLIFIAVFWGKYKCPNCGSVGRNHPNSDAQSLEPATEPVGNNTKLCPFCAETIKQAAIICRYCNRDISA